MWIIINVNWQSYFSYIKCIQNKRINYGAVNMAFDSTEQQIGEVIKQMEK